MIMSRNTTRNRVPTFIPTLAVMFLAGCDGIVSLAKPHLSGFQCEPDAGVYNQQFDAGWAAVFYLTNNGSPGEVYIRAELSTSEGEWYREQTIQFDEGESRSLRFFFHEPTINASNITCIVKTIPEATQ